MLQIVLRSPLQVSYDLLNVHTYCNATAYPTHFCPFRSLTSETLIKYYSLLWRKRIAHPDPFCITSRTVTVKAITHWWSYISFHFLNIIVSRTVPKIDEPASWTLHSVSYESDLLSRQWVVYVSSALLVVIKRSSSQPRERTPWRLMWSSTSPWILALLAELWTRW